MPKARAGLSPTVTNNGFRPGRAHHSHSWAPRYKASTWQERGKLRQACRSFRFRAGFRPHGGPETSDRSERPGCDANIYRCSGALTITRAATTEREIEALPDPLTIDLRGREDGHGRRLADLPHGPRPRRQGDRRQPRRRRPARTGRRADHPVRSAPKKRPGGVARAGELGEWTVEAGRPWSACSASSARR
jgi:hypothetical protein